MFWVLVISAIVISLLVSLLREDKKCAHCGSRHGSRHHNFSRGYNTLCEQSSGDWGFYCMKCQQITWDKPYEEYVKSLARAPWVNPDTNEWARTGKRT